MNYPILIFIDQSAEYLAVSGLAAKIRVKFKLKIVELVLF